MTLPEFLDAFRACAGAYHWEDAGRGLRGEPHISIPSLGSAIVCPITAVVWDRLHIGYRPGSALAAALVLGLDENDAEVIIAAADSDIWPEGSKLRRKLYTIAGLAVTDAPY